MAMPRALLLDTANVHFDNDSAEYAFAALLINRVRKQNPRLSELVPTA